MQATGPHTSFTTTDRGPAHARRVAHVVAERTFWIALVAATVIALAQVGSVVLGVAGPFAGLGLLPLVGWAGAIAAAGVVAATRDADPVPRPGWLMPVLLSAATYPVLVAALLHLLGAGAA